MLLLVLSVLLVSYATSLRAWFEQRQQITGLEADIVASEQQISELARERRRWRDPAYVEAQARERFGWVLPGEIGLRVIGKDGQPLDTSSELTDPATLPAPARDWWAKAYSSLHTAGAHPDEAAARAPRPAQRLGPEPRRRDGPARRDR